MTLRTLRPTVGRRLSTSSTCSTSVVAQGGDSWEAKTDCDAYVKAGDTCTDARYSRWTSELTAFPSRVVYALLPFGYPASVKSGYHQYVIGQMTGAVASSAAGVFSMQALLHAVGLGQGAIPMAAALNWVIKDGLGQFGGGK